MDYEMELENLKQVLTDHNLIRITIGEEYEETVQWYTGQIRKKYNILNRHLRFIPTTNTKDDLEKVVEELDEIHKAISRNTITTNKTNTKRNLPQHEDEKEEEEEIRPARWWRREEYTDHSLLLSINKIAQTVIVCE